MCIGGATRSLGIIVGMAAEARLLRRLGCAIGIGGGTPVGALRMARQLIDDGATILMSFGLAGGLDPSLRAGDLIVPSAVLSHGQEYICDPGLTASLNGRSVQVLWAAEAPVASATEKQRLWRDEGAAAVDLESGAVAEAAAAAGLPFAVLRAICDPATRDLPRAAVVALDNSGRISQMKMAETLIRHPQDLFGLAALARDALRARRALVGGAESLRRLAAGEANLGRLVT